MALLRAGLVVTMMFMFLVILAPVSVSGGRLLHEEEATGGRSRILWSGSDRSGVELVGSPGHIARGFSGRKMLAAVSKAASEPRDEAPTAQQLEGHASSVDSTSTAPAPPAPFKSRFAFLFRSLAKGSSPPSTGTPSPGHN